MKKNKAFLEEYFGIWKIGTSISNYIDKSIINWFKCKNFLDKFLEDKNKKFYFDKNTNKFQNLFDSNDTSEENYLFFYDNGKPKLSDSVFRQIWNVLYYLEFISYSSDSSYIELSYTFRDFFEKNYNTKNLEKLIYQYASDSFFRISNEIIENLKKYKGCYQNSNENCEDIKKKLGESKKELITSIWYSFWEINDMKIDYSVFFDLKNKNKLVKDYENFIKKCSENNKKFDEQLLYIFKKLKEIYDKDLYIKIEIKDYVLLNENINEENIYKLNIENYNIEQKKEAEKEDINQFKSKTFNLYNFINEYLLNSPNNKWSFIIPSYQRNYVWDKYNLKTLLSNINEITISEKTYSHFIGSLFFTNNEETMEFNIVDGQQRITSLILILFAIYNIIFYNIKSNKELKIEKNLLNLFNKKANPNKDENSNYIISKFPDIKNSESLKYLYSLLNGQDLEEKKTLPLIFENYKFIIQYLYKILSDNNNKIDKNKLEKFTEKLYKYIEFSVINTKQKNQDFKIFSYINSTGKKLNVLEIVRADIFGLSEESDSQNTKTNINNYNKYFVENIEKNNINILEFIYYFHAIEIKANDNFKFEFSSKENREYDFFKNYFYEYKKEIKLNEKIKILVQHLLFYIAITKIGSTNKNKKDFEIWKTPIEEIIKDNPENLNINSNFLNNVKKILPKIYIYINLYNEKTTMTTLIYAILNKNELWKSEKELSDNDLNKEIKKFHKFLLEIQKFNFVWKIIYFEGQSIRKNIEKIAIDIINQEIKDEKQLFKELLKILGLTNNDEWRNHSKRKIEEYFLNEKLNDNKTSKNLLIVIDYYLKNKKSMELNNSDFLEEMVKSYFKMTLEHLLSQDLIKETKNEKLEKICYQIGNHFIFTQGKNSELKNKHINEKIKKIKKIINENEKIISIGNDVNEIELENIKNESEKIGKNWIEDPEKINKMEKIFKTRTKILSDYLLEIFDFKNKK
ncbi:DUF262 domain-containing protein [Mycoplasmopsis synoviae]|uniref:DUF262 domain-containing protein n=1 Tax=Mycoplasmopsis synoviae TaxID=2109 RepID=UPI003567F743